MRNKTLCVFIACVTWPLIFFDTLQGKTDSAVADLAEICSVDPGEFFLVGSDTPIKDQLDRRLATACLKYPARVIFDPLNGEGEEEDEGEGEEEDEGEGEEEDEGEGEEEDEGEGPKPVDGQPGYFQDDDGNWYYDTDGDGIPDQKWEDGGWVPYEPPNSTDPDEGEEEDDGEDEDEGEDEDDGEPVLPLLVDPEWYERIKRNWDYYGVPVTPAGPFDRWFRPNNVNPNYWPPPPTPADWPEGLPFPPLDWPGGIDPTDWDTVPSLPGWYRFIDPCGDPFYYHPGPPPAYHYGLPPNFDPSIPPWEAGEPLIPMPLRRSR